MSEFLSKTIVITGSSKGFGKELAKEFLHKGHNVVICSKSSKNIREVSAELNTFENVLPLVIDIQNYNDCKELHDLTVERFDHVDILINNAATNLNVRQDFLLFDQKEIDTVIGTNLIGLIYCHTVFLPHMISRNEGVIINVEGSGSRTFDETKGYSLYSCTKAAVTSFTNTIRQENKDHNVHICTLSPGMMHTNILWTKNVSNEMKTVFTIFGEYPNIVAKAMVEEILNIKEDKRIEYLTWFKIIQKMMIYIMFKKDEKDPFL